MEVYNNTDQVTLVVTTDGIIQIIMGNWYKISRIKRRLLLSGVSECQMLEFKSN